MSRISFLGLIDNLKSTITKLKWHPRESEWADYYNDTNYSEDAFEHKKQVVAEFLDKMKPSSVWDFGSNRGVYSQIASEKGIQVVSFDMDPVVAEMNYLKGRRGDRDNILPLVLDITNPSPGIGWMHQERMPLMERGPADMVFFLALIHHLVICNNLPLYKIADFLFEICNSLIIEFVPQSDSNAQRLLSSRDKPLTGYSQDEFEKAFNKLFVIIAATPLRNSERVIYLMERRKIQNK